MRFHAFSVFFSTFLLASFLHAQTVAMDRTSFGINDCRANNTDIVNVTITTPQQLTTSILQLWATSTASAPTTTGSTSSVCPPQPTGVMSQITASPIQNPATNPLVVTYQANVNQLMTSQICQMGGSSGSSGTMALCLYQNNASTLNLVAGTTYTYSTLIPTVSDITNIQETHGQIAFSVAANTSAATYTTCYGLSSGGDISGTNCPSPFVTQTDSQPNIVLQDLTDFKQYTFKVQLTDSSGDTGPWSDAHFATPGPVATPLQHLDLPTDPVSTSCQSTSSPSTLLSFIVVALALWRVRKQQNKQESHGHNSFFLLCLGFLFSTTALGDAGQISLGIQGSPYLPNIDGSRQAGGNPIDIPVYQRFFQTDPNNPTGPWQALMGIDLNVHLLDSVGTLQIGMSANYAYAAGAGRKLQADGSIDWGNSNGNVALHMLQLRPHLTYIYDQYIEDVPFAPFVRAGLVGAGYLWNYNGAPDTSGQADGQNPLGARFGYELAAGLYFLMDVLEPDAANGARSRGVYDHVYLRAEIAFMPINNFYSSGLDFSPIGLFGSPLPLLFTGALVIEFQ